MVSLLSSAYFGPVQWYQKLNRSAHCLIECHDHFIKQTYRNRCIIAATNGLQALTVPIERYEGAHCEMQNIRISSHGMPYNRPTVKALFSSFMPTTCVHSLSTAGIFWSILIWKSQKKCVNCSIFIPA